MVVEDVVALRDVEYGWFSGAMSLSMSCRSMRSEVMCAFVMMADRRVSIVAGAWRKLLVAGHFVQICL